jgi:hypothetical protein
LNWREKTTENSNAVFCRKI